MGGVGYYNLSKEKDLVFSVPCTAMFCQQCGRTDARTRSITYDFSTIPYAIQRGFHGEFRDIEYTFCSNDCQMVYARRKMATLDEHTPNAEFAAHGTRRRVAHQDQHEADEAAG